MTPLTPEQKTALRQKIVEANPDIAYECRWCSLPFKICSCTGANFEGRNIRLADVLLALQSRWPEQYAMSMNGTLLENENRTPTPTPFASRFLSTCCAWNLRIDNLDQQSEETLAFLHSLLCP